MLTEQQNKRIDQLEAYVRRERLNRGYGSYPPIEENKATIEILTNILAYCLLIRGNH